MNTEDKIAEQAAEIARLNAALANRKAKIAELMGEAARAEMVGASASLTVDRNTAAEEGAEIIGSMIDSIEQYGNYSTEATLTFLAQAKQCFDEIKSATAPAPVSGMPDLAKLQKWSASRRALGAMERSSSGAYFSVADVEALFPSPQAPDAPVVPECEPCNGMGIQDGSGEICPKCHGEGVTHTGIDESPTIVDADGLPQAVAAILRSNGDIISLANLYALIDAWGEKQRALAARQSPAEDEFAKIMSDANVTHIACMMGNIIYNLSQKKGHMLTATDCEMFNSLRKQWDAARQAPPKLHKDYCQRCLRVHASVDCAPADLARLAPDSRDAARYRWLRDKSDPGICAFYLSVGKAFDGVKFNQGTVDCAIDAQIIAQEKAQ